MHGAERAAQKRGEQERREVVDLEGEFVAVGGDRTLRSCDQPGIVDQHVDARVLAGQPRGKLTHLAEVGKVGDITLRADLRSDRAGLPR